MDPVGLGAAGIVLVAGVAGGLWRRRVDGRLRHVTPRRGEEHSVTEAAGGERNVVVRSGGERDAAVRAGGERDEAVRAGGYPDAADRAGGPAGEGSAAELIDPAVLRELGVGPARATLLQFSSAFCAPCRALRRISAEVAAMVPGVRHVEVDAESHLAAVRALEIWRTPTLLILDADGRIVRRATGVPGKPQLIAALGELLPESRD